MDPIHDRRFLAKLLRSIADSLERPGQEVVVQNPHLEEDDGELLMDMAGEINGALGLEDSIIMTKLTSKGDLIFQTELNR